MALLTVACAKGSPGVTTFSMVVAAMWPRPVLLADCDPVGGDVALRMPGHDGGRLDPERGLVSLAAGGRHGLQPQQINEHVQTLAGGLDVLAGVRSPEQAQAMGTAWRDLGAYLGALRGIDVVADAGRLGPAEAHATSTLPLLLASRLVVLVCRPDLSSVVHLRERVGTLTRLLRPGAGDGVPLRVLVVAPPEEQRAVDGIRDVLAREHPDVTVAGHLAFDPKGALFFAGGPPVRLDKSPLIRSGRVLAGQFADALAPFWVSTVERAPRSTLPAGHPPGLAQPPAPQPPEPQHPASSPPEPLPWDRGRGVTGLGVTGLGVTGLGYAGPSDADPGYTGPGDTGSYRADYPGFSALAETAFAGQPAAERGDEA
jgi:hypothetical protein